MNVQKQYKIKNLKEQFSPIQIIEVQYYILRSIREKNINRNVNSIPLFKDPFTQDNQQDLYQNISNNLIFDLVLSNLGFIIISIIYQSFLLLNYIKDKLDYIQAIIQ
ncbi:unnamed protein product [Paramecium pentaurelia]|uniref:Transmembrane protein n=1 Tax=Paramecium pentaurelia TaxID=43138 RepID=A0A8S1SPI4_9CILI|nr:unnamed protein product [Paramecium pentaurelia]